MPLNPERLPGADSRAYLNLSNLAAYPYTFRAGHHRAAAPARRARALPIDGDAVGACAGVSLPTGSTSYSRRDHVVAQGQSMGGLYANLVGAVEPRVIGGAPHRLGRVVEPGGPEATPRHPTPGRRSAPCCSAPRPAHPPAPGAGAARDGLGMGGDRGVHAAPRPPSAAGTSGAVNLSAGRARRPRVSRRRLRAWRSRLVTRRRARSLARCCPTRSTLVGRGRSRLPGGATSRASRGTPYTGVVAQYNGDGVTIAHRISSSSTR